MPTKHLPPLLRSFVVSLFFFFFFFVLRVAPSPVPLNHFSKQMECCLCMSYKMELQHFCHNEHPLVFNEERIYGKDCFGCQEQILGPCYSCIKCKWFYHHESCAELPIELYHPLHPKHPLILCDKYKYKDDKEYSKC